MPPFPFIILTLSHSKLVSTRAQISSQIQIVMLKANLLPKPNSSYTKTSIDKVTGQEIKTVVFRYSVTGTPEEMKAYADAKGKNNRVDDKTGQTLFFSTKYVGDNVDLLILANGDVIIDTSELRKAEAVVKAMGGDLGKAFADETAKRFMNGNSEE